MEKFFKHPWVIVGVIALITVFFALQLPRAEMDSSTDSLFPDGNEVHIIAEHIKDLFGEETAIFIGLERKFNTVFEQAFLASIRDFTNTVEQIPIVKEVTSILTMPYITADSESIYVTDLVDEDFTGTQAEIAELKRRLASWELYDGAIVSGDFAATQVVVRLNISLEQVKEPSVISDIKQIRTAAEDAFSGFAAIYLTGEPIISDIINESMQTDLRRLIPLVFVVLLAVLCFSFRRFAFVTLPLLTVVIAAIWTIGAMPLFGFTLSMLSIILPIILIAVGSAYGIHIVSHYISDNSDSIATLDDHRCLVFAVLRKVFKPVLLTALTTIAGFGSLCFAWITPIRDFGYFACFGVAFSILIALTLIPAMLIIRGPRQKKIKQLENKNVRFQAGLNTILADILSAAAAKRGIVLAVTLAVVILSGYGLSKIIVENNPIHYFREDSEVSRSDRFIRQYFGGTSQVNVVVEADTTETLLNPKVLTALDNLSSYLKERVPYVGKVSGFTDMVKRMNQMFYVDEPPEGVRALSGYSAGNAAQDWDFGLGEFGFGVFDFDDFDNTQDNYELMKNDEKAGTQPDSAITFAMLNSAITHSGLTAVELVRELQRRTNFEGRSYYEIPSDPARYNKRNNEELAALIADYLVVVGGNTDQGFANDPLEPTAIRSSIQISSEWMKDTYVVVDAANDFIAANFPENVNVIIGGGSMVVAELTDLVMKSQIASVIIAVIAVFIIIAIANRSIVSGFFAAVPLALAILCNFGIMGLAGITLNQATALVSSLAIGIGIDYTIHFLEIFKLEYRKGGDFLKRTYSGCGKAIITNALSVGGGFAVLAFSQFRFLAHFGILIALSMIITAVISLTVMPVLFTLIKPKFIYGTGSTSC